MPGGIFRDQLLGWPGDLLPISQYMANADVNHVLPVTAAIRAREPFERNRDYFLHRGDKTPPKAASGSHRLSCDAHRLRRGQNYSRRLQSDRDISG